MTLNHKNSVYTIMCMTDPPPTHTHTRHKVVQAPFDLPGFAWILILSSVTPENVATVLFTLYIVQNKKSS